MSALLRFLGLKNAPAAAPDACETETVRRIAARLDQVDPQIAK